MHKLKIENMDYNEKCEKTDIGNSKNVEKIKQFMTSTDNQLPDISRECADIGSELRYFFNDDDLIIYRKANEESISSIFHEEAFYTQIKGVYEEWKKRKDQLFKKEGTTDKLQQNFIDFVEFWLMSDQSIQLIYHQHHQIIKEEQYGGQTFMEEKKINLQPQTQIKTSKISNNQIINKRLYKIFCHYSTKCQNITNAKTFDEINSKYETMNIASWFKFIKGFQFFHKAKTTAEDKCKLKIIFQHFSQHKKLAFRDFQESLKAIFYYIFKDDSQHSIQKGYHKMCLTSNTQYEKKMNQIGIYVPKQVYYSHKTKTNKNLKVNSRYLQKYDHRSSQGSIESFEHGNSLRESKNFKSIKLKQLPKIPQKRVRGKQNKELFSCELMNEADQFLSLYETKQHGSLGMLRRIDERIGKMLLKK